MPAPAHSQIAIAAAALSSDPRQAASRARSIGFGGLQFEVFSHALSLPELSQSGRREFLHLLSPQSQQLASLGMDIGPRGLSPGADVDRVLHRLDQAMQAAAGFAAPLLCIDLGPLPEPAGPATLRPAISPAQAGLIIIPSPAPASSEPAEPERPADPVFESGVDGALAELGKRADRYSVTLAFRSDLASLAALDRALRAADCPWFGVDLDPVSILRDRWDESEAFSRLGPLIRHVRARDALSGSNGRTRPAVMGGGNCNWPQLLALLDEAEFNGWITIDPLELPERAQAAQAGLAVLRRAWTLRQ